MHMHMNMREHKLLLMIYATLGFDIVKYLCSDCSIHTQPVRIPENVLHVVHEVMHFDLAVHKLHVDFINMS